MNNFETHMDQLIKEYENEGCEFSEDTCRNLLKLYTSRMEDCHLKCVLYRYLKYQKEK
jgi:hypothetical protein